MITQKELNSIDRSYFTVITEGCYGVTLKSNNTRHCWYIACEDLGYCQSFRILHTHHEGTPMHEHGHGKTLGSCIRQIRSHDEYQLKKNARKRRLARDRRRMARINEADSLITTF
ncbi:MAG: hypothetical protein IJ719_11570 [Clostridia bacterium]|nr:hypothetical protein [Clostridia bacterium]